MLAASQGKKSEESLSFSVFARNVALGQFHNNIIIMDVDHLLHVQDTILLYEPAYAH